MDGGKGLAATEQASIGYQFARGAQIIFLVFKVKKHVSRAGPDQENGMQYRTTERWKNYQGNQRNSNYDKNHSASLPAAEVHQQFYQAANDAEHTGHQGNAHQDSEQIGYQLG